MESQYNIVNKKSCLESMPLFPEIIFTKLKLPTRVTHRLSHIAGSAQYCHFQKSEKWIYCFLLMFRKKSSQQMCCNPTVCFKIRVIKFKSYCNSKISQHLQNFKTLFFFFQKEEVVSYDNIALNQRYVGKTFKIRSELLEMISPIE